MSRSAAEALLDGVPHGFKLYRLGCRCDDCRAANAADQRAYQLRRKERFLAAGLDPRRITVSRRGEIREMAVRTLSIGSPVFLARPVRRGSQDCIFALAGLLAHTLTDLHIDAEVLRDGDIGFAFVSAEQASRATAYGVVTVSPHHVDAAIARLIRRHA